MGYQGANVSGVRTLAMQNSIIMLKPPERMPGEAIDASTFEHLLAALTLAQIEPSLLKHSGSSKCLFNPNPIPLTESLICLGLPTEALSSAVSNDYYKLLNLFI